MDFGNDLRSQVIAERRQHIRDMAPCIWCYWPAKQCANINAAHADRHPDDPARDADLCSQHAGFCRHIEDPAMFRALLDEIAADGPVRTVAEVDPPPMQGPRKVTLSWLLGQDVWWYPKGRPAVRVASMDKPWRLNTLRFLERRAVAVKYGPGMRHLHDAPDDVWASWEHEDPLEHLHGYPLVKALRHGLPGRPDKLAALEERARHWSTCPMRKAHPGIRDRCVCITDDAGRTVGATSA